MSIYVIAVENIWAFLCKDLSNSSPIVVKHAVVDMSVNQILPKTYLMNRVKDVSHLNRSVYEMTRSDQMLCSFPKYASSVSNDIVVVWGKTFSALRNFARI